MKKLQIGRIYRHFKGGKYKILGLAHDSETLDKVVIYQSLVDNKVWVRPEKMFLGVVKKEDKMVKRFALIKHVLASGKEIRMDAKIKIAVGSENPVKIKAVKRALKKVYSHALFMSVAIESKVGSQPIGDREIQTGAINRAQAVLKKVGADLGVGLEGGVIKTRRGLMESAWCAIVSKKGELGLGGGMHFMLPKIIGDKILAGGELGPIMDKLTGKKDIKKKGGAIAFLTQGLLTRTQAYTHLVKLASVKFLSPEVFKNPKFPQF